MRSFLIALYFSFLIAALTGCSSTTRKEEIKDSNENIRTSSDVLSVLPAAYEGSVDSDMADSLKLSLRLENGQNYILKQTYKGLSKSKGDSTDIDNGTWTLTDENVITLYSLELNKDVYKFKINDSDVIIHLDSAGREFQSGNNHVLHKTIPDSININ